jgi:hypothetical protein
MKFIFHVAYRFVTGNTFKDSFDFISWKRIFLKVKIKISIYERNIAKVGCR